MSQTPRGKSFRLQNSQTDTTNNPRVEAFLAAQAAGASAGSSTGTSSSPVSLAANVPPRILAITPDSGFSSTDLVTNVSRVTLRGSGTAGSRVYVQVDGVQVGVVTTASNGTWQWTLSAGLAGNEHRITAYSLAADGTRLNSNAANVTIDQTGPQLTLNDLAAGQDTGADARDFITQTRNLTLTGTGEVGSRLTLSINGGAATTVAIGSNGTWSYDPPSHLTDGTYRVLIREEDRAGNVSIHRQDIVIDNQGPNQPSFVLMDDVTGGVLGEIAGGGVSNDARPAVEGAVPDGATYIEVSVDNGAWNRASIANGHFSYTPATIGDGNHVIHVRAIDAAGNVSNIADQTVTIDTTGPVITLDNIGLAASAGSFDGQLAASETASFALAGAAQHGTVTVNADGTYHYVPVVGYIGADSFNVRVTDGAGNSVTQSVAVTIQRDGELPINDSTEGDQFNPVVTVLNDGGVVVTWQSGATDGSGALIRGQLYDAQGAPRGEEFQVSASLAYLYPIVTPLIDGGFVVTWAAGVTAPGYAEVYGQRYDSNGSATGAAFRINSYTLEGQNTPSATALPDGGFVVTWQSTGQDGIPGSIHGQRYGALGAAAGNEFRIDVAVAGFQVNPMVIGITDGGFVVAWQAIGPDGSLFYGQRYDDQGSAIGGNFAINNNVSGYLRNLTLTSLNDGGFVVTWQDVGNDGTNDIYGRQYDAQGSAIGGESRISNIFGSQQAAKVASLSDGGYVVTWEFDNGAGPDIYGRRYDTLGVGGAEFQINTYTPGFQQVPVVTGLDDGGFVVAWRSFGQDGSFYGVYGQRFDADGNRIGQEFRVNDFTSGSQLNPAISALDDGGFIVTWQSDGQDGMGLGIYGQRYDVNGNRAGVTLLGGAGNQALVGGDLADRIDGGAGSDTIDGGASTDRIIYGADALQTAGAVDTIRNFDASGSTTIGDHVDLHDLLTSLGFANDAASRALGTAFQIVDQGGGNFDLRIDADRSGGGSFEVTLTHIQVTAGTLDASDFILV